MGVDITIRAYDSNGVKINNFSFFDDGSRCYSWFDNLCGAGYDWRYEFLPNERLFSNSENVPEEILQELNSDGYYNFFRISVKDLIEWVDKYNPTLDAGWFSKYDAWRIKHGWILDSEFDDVAHIKPDNNGDWEFCEYIRRDFTVEMLNEYLRVSSDIDGYIYYYFDC